MKISLGDALRSPDTEPLAFAVRSHRGVDLQCAVWYILADAAAMQNRLDYSPARSAETQDLFS